MMRARSTAIVMALAALLLPGCRAHSVSVAAAEAPPLSANSPSPIVETPVGPLPGQPDTGLVEPPNPFSGDESARIDGRHLFNAFNCSGCHGDHGGGGMGPSLRDEDWIYGGTPAKVASSIAQGRAHGMPAWGTKLTSEQVWKLTTYVKSLRTPQEPEPPAGN